MPAISVIIPAFNAAPFLATAIQSVLDQTFRDFEIIVIDDGSTDNTQEVASAFSNSIQYIKTSNGGPSAARNLGIKCSSGRFIAFLDADDWWLPTKLEQQIQTLLKNSDIAFVCGDWFNGVNGDESRISVLSEYQVWLQPATFDIMLEENFVNSSTVLVEREKLLHTGGFMENLRGAEDRHLWLRLLLNGNAHVCKEIVAFRRFHPNNTTATLPFIESQVKMVEDVLTWPSVTTHTIRLTKTRERRDELLISLAYKYSSMGKYKESSKVYKQLFAESPWRFQAAVRWLIFGLFGFFRKFP